MRGKRSFFKRTGKTALILLLSAAVLAPLGAEELTDEEKAMPVWVLMEKGIAAFREGDFATALTFFTYSRNKGAVLPEGEYWMGRVYEEEGELPLAVVQYEKALDQARYLYIAGDRTEIEYRLAGAYLKEGDLKNYEFRLQTMIDGEVKRSRDVMEREHLYITILKEKGLDELLYLYRLDYTKSLRAFRELGAFYCKGGDYRSGVLYNLYAVMTYFSQGIGTLILTDPEFQFPRTREKLMEYDPAWYYDDLERAVRRLEGDFSFIREGNTRRLINGDAQVADALKRLEEGGRPYVYSGVGYVLDLFKENRGLALFMEENNVYQSLYYLACSLYGEGFEDRAREIWQILDRDGDGKGWTLLAREQLAHPGLDKKAVLF